MEDYVIYIISWGTPAFISKGRVPKDIEKLRCHCRDLCVILYGIGDTSTRCLIIKWQLGRAAGKVMLFTPTPPHLRSTSIPQKVPRLATAQTKDVLVRYGRDPFHPAWCSALAA
jgi:hypothetical protein